MTAKASLDQQLRDEAREAALDHFGQDATPEVIARVYECEMEMFTFHCATGDDLDCTCGAHGRFERGPEPKYQPEDFA